VSSTQIFARRIDETRQALVYSMRVAIDEPLAMVLPLPVVPGSGDDAVAFVDLSGYPEFFSDLDDAFPTPTPSRFGGLAAAAAIPDNAKPLVVHDVGDFVASYVPSRADFTRLDPQFRIPDGVFDAHAEYADYGYAVFQLKPQPAPPPPKKRWFRRAPPPIDPGGEHAVHPMAFTFPSRRPGALYFPTLHVHDGAVVPREARFDHELYCQSSDAVLTRTFAWRASDKQLGKYVDAKRAADLVTGKDLAYRSVIAGMQPNTDHWYEAPRCTIESLDVRGDHFACKLSATTAYLTAPSEPKLERWRATARTKLDALSAGLREGLRALTAEHGARWNLGRAEHADRCMTAYLSNWEPFIFTSTAIEKLAPDASTTIALDIPAEGENVETQNVTLVFTRVPSKDTVLEIRSAIGQILDRAVA
jgi:hypothetical protein